MQQRLANIKKPQNLRHPHGKRSSLVSCFQLRLWVLYLFVPLSAFLPLYLFMCRPHILCRCPTFLFVCYIFFFNYGYICVCSFVRDYTTANIVIKSPHFFQKKYIAQFANSNNFSTIPKLCCIKFFYKFVNFAKISANQKKIIEFQNFYNISRKMCEFLGNFIKNSVL